MKRPATCILLILLLLFLGVSAAIGGVVMMFFPRLMPSPESLLAQTPFSGYFLPGLVLFTFNGAVPLLASIGLWRQPAWPWANALNLYPDRHWAWAYALYSGFIVIIWITVQTMMIPFIWLQPAYVTIGLLILVTALTPGVMRYYLL